MKRWLQTVLAFSLLAASFGQINALAYQKAKDGAPPATVTGTYKDVLNRLDVTELPDHKVRIKFSGFWPNDRTRVETRTVGSFDETVPLIENTASVKIHFGEDPCIIKLEFRQNKVIAAQEGSLMGCGFGFNVEPDGTYLKVSPKPAAPPRRR